MKHVELIIYVRLIAQGPPQGFSQVKILNKIHIKKTATQKRNIKNTVDNLNIVLSVLLLCTKARMLRHAGNVDLAA